MQRPQPPGGAGLRTTAQRLLAGALAGGMVLPYAGVLAESVLPVAGAPEVPVEPIPVELGGLLSVEGVVVLGAGAGALLVSSVLRLQALRASKADSATAAATTNFRLKAYIAVPFKN